MGLSRNDIDTYNFFHDGQFITSGKLLERIQLFSGILHHGDMPQNPFGNMRLSFIYPLGIPLNFLLQKILKFSFQIIVIFSFQIILAIYFQLI